MLFPFEIIAKAAEEHGFYGEFMHIAMFESRIVFNNKQLYFALRDIAFTADDNPNPFYILACDNIVAIGGIPYCSHCYRKIKCAQGCNCTNKRQKRY